MVLITDDQYYNNLPPNGLALAEQTLQQDYEMLLENGLPVAGTVAGLLTVQTLQEDSQEENTHA